MILGILITVLLELCNHVHTRRHHTHSMSSDAETLDKPSRTVNTLTDTHCSDRNSVNLVQEEIASKYFSDPGLKTQASCPRENVNCEAPIVGAESDVLRKTDSFDEDLESTLPYDADLESSPNPQAPSYTIGDFVTSESDSESDEEVEDSNMGVKQSKTTSPGPEVKKYKQTTLNFGSKKEGEKPSTKNQRNSKKKRGDDRKRWGLRYSDRDTEMYRRGYPGKVDNRDLKDNLRFYQGKIQSSPDGAYIDEIHEKWKGNYKLLERHHGYIQWIFPIREDGMNWNAQALQLHEAEAIKADKDASKRVLTSYKLMLDFYGMKLLDAKSGQLGRSEKWRDRFHNLNWSSHNYLRITRILKSLGELGLEHLKKAFLMFVLEEALEKGTLDRTVNSCRNYWVGTVKHDADREELYTYIEEHGG